MKNKVITAVAVLALGATTIAFAAPHGDGFGGKGHRHGGFSQKLAQKLNLTDAQKQQVQDIQRASRDQNKAFFESARATRQELRAAKEANDTAKVESLKATMESQRAQFKQIREAEMQKIAAVLTPEQNAQLQQLKAQRMEHKRDRR